MAEPMPSKRYLLAYRNQEWLYSVYRSDDGEDYLLVAVVPGVGWYDIAMILDPSEVEVFLAKNDELTGVVNAFLQGRDRPRYKKRRIEYRVKNIDIKTVLVEDAAEE